MIKKTLYVPDRFGENRVMFSIENNENEYTTGFELVLENIRFFRNGLNRHTNLKVFISIHKYYKPDNFKNGFEPLNSVGVFEYVFNAVFD